MRFDDDGPDARNNFDNIQTNDGGVTFFAAGNVISGASTISPATGSDIVGADTPGKITGASGVGGVDVDPAGDFVVQGLYGKLTMKENGDYDYDLDETKIGSIPSGATETFNYRLTDGDGDSDVATLTIKFPEAKIPKTEIGVGEHMNGVMKEDVSSPIYFEVDPQQSSDTVVHVKITGLIGWNLGVIDGATVDILGPSVDSNITFDPVTGVLEFDVTGAAAGETITGFFNALPPQDTDKDQPLTITATVQDGPVTAVGTDNTTVVVDAVLDQFLDVTAGAIAPVVEPVVNTPVTLNLTSAFAGGAGTPFANSFAGGAGADGDGSEVVVLTAKITVTGDVAQLQLTAPIAGVSLTETATPGVWNLVANNLANLQLALTQVQAVVPTGFNGVINGFVEVTTKEANTPQGTVPASGQEPQTTDNTYTDKTNFSITVEDGVKSPTVGVNFTAPSLVIKEDSSAFFIVTANVPDASDKISKLNFTGLEALILAGWGVVVTPEAPTTGAYVAGEFTVTSVGQTAQVRVTLTPPADSDRDVINDILADITVTATAADISNPALQATSAVLPVDVDVDAVLDQYAAVNPTASPTASESGAVQNVNLNLAMTINPGLFPLSGAGGPDGDNSEVRPVSATITLSTVVVDLTLAAGFPVGTTLVETPVGSGVWTLTASNAANLQSAVTFVEAIIPPNFNGAVNVSVQVGTAEANTPPATPGSVVPGSGQEYDNSDNAISAIGFFNLTVNNSAQNAISGEICFAEDGVFNQYDKSLPQTVELGEIFASVMTLGVDETLTSLTISGLPVGASLSINGIAVAASGILTPAQIVDWIGGHPIVVTPPADRDNDFVLGFSGTTTDGSSGAVSPISGSVTVLVDAAADDPTSVSIDVISTSGDEQFAQNETGTAKITATFGDVTDGSEAHTLTITAPAGFTFPSVNTLDGILPANISGLGTGTVTVIVPAGDTGVSNFVLNVQAPANFVGTPTFNVEAKAVETPADLGCGPDDADDKTNNVATQTASDEVTFKADLAPINYNDAKSGDEPGQDKNNVMIIFDHSGSMDADADGDGPGTATRLQLARAAVEALLNKFDLLGDVKVKMVIFANDATAMTFWGTVAQALAFLDDPTIHNPLGSLTSYSDALQTAGTGLTTNTTGMLTGAGVKTHVYFLSDGIPTADGANPGSDGSVSHSLTAGQQTAWNTALETANVDRVIAVGVGGDIPVGDDDLEAVASPNGNPNGDPVGQVVIVDDENDLAAVLASTVEATPIGGNVLDGSIGVENPLTPDFPGDAPAHIAFFSYTDPNLGNGDKSVTFTWTGNPANPLVVVGAAPISITDQTAVFLTEHGKMTFYFKAVPGHAAGDFEFIPNSISGNADATETFKYYTRDLDGDIEPGAPGNGLPGAGGATLVITINNINQAPVAVNDSANGTEGLVVTIPFANLLVNDTDPDGDSLTVASAQDPVNGTVQIVGTDVKFTPNPGYHGPASFTYTITDGSLTSTATVNLVIASSNVAPVGNIDHIYTNSTEDVTVQSAWLLANDSDADGDPLSISGVDENTNKLNEINGDGLPTSFFFDLSGGNTDDIDTADFTYDLTDGEATTVVAAQIHLDSDDAIINGSAGKDIILAVNAAVRGGAGDDLIVGYGTSDTLDYSNVLGDWNLNLGNNGKGTASVPGQGTDTYEGIENLSGGDGKNQLGGNSSANILNGNGGDDTLNGGDGSDTLTGGAGTDALNGEGGDDILNYDSSDAHDGGANFDRLAVGGAGTNVVYGTALVQSIEMIDLGNSNHNQARSVTSISITDILAEDDNNTTGLSSGGQTIDLLIVGDNASGNKDSVQLSNDGSGSWQLVSDNVSVGGLGTFDIYRNTAGGGDGQATIAVEDGLNVTIVA